MKAIILAAGEGSRLRPLTADRPKALVEYQGRPIVDYQIQSMRRVGIHNVVLVVGYKAEAFPYRDVTYIANPFYASTNMVYTLFCARDLFTGDVVVSYGDIIYPANVLEALVKSPDGISVAVSKNWRELWSKRMTDPLADAETMKIDSNGFIRELGKKPKSYDEIQGQYMGVFLIRKAALPKVIEVYDRMDREALYDGKEFNRMFMTSFLQHLIDQGIPVRAVPVESEWLEIDCAADLKVEIDLQGAPAI